jgi:hypothetical protein
MKALIALVALAFAAGGASCCRREEGTLGSPEGAAGENESFCNAEAEKGLKGDERKQLHEHLPRVPSRRKATQQDKMKSCNAKPAARQLKGDERKKFMSECLKASPVAAVANAAAQGPGFPRLDDAAISTMR